MAGSAGPICAGPVEGAWRGGTGTQEPGLCQAGRQKTVTPSKKAAQSQEVFLRAYVAAGGPLVTGSDVGPDFVIPGLAIHQEMDHLVSMGVAPIDALRASTLHAARALEIADKAGSLEPGRFGNLLSLEQDPLADVTRTRRIRWAVVRGRVVHGPAAEPRQPGGR